MKYTTPIHQASKVHVDTCGMRTLVPRKVALASQREESLSNIRPVVEEDGHARVISQLKACHR